MEIFPNIEGRFSLQTQFNLIFIWKLHSVKVMEKLNLVSWDPLFSRRLWLCSGGPRWRQHLTLESFVYLVSAKVGTVSSVPDLGSTEVSTEAPHPCCSGFCRWTGELAPVHLGHHWESRESACISEGCAGHKKLVKLSVVPSSAQLLPGDSLPPWDSIRAQRVGISILTMSFHVPTSSTPISPPKIFSSF